MPRNESLARGELAWDLSITRIGSPEPQCSEDISIGAHQCPIHALGHTNCIVWKLKAIKCLRRCSWSAWVVYHVRKLQIKKEIKKLESENEKSNLSTDLYFGRISLFKNPIDSWLDGLEPWLKYLQLFSFEFFEIHNFWRLKLTHKLQL